MSLINDALKRAQEAQRKDNPAYIVSPMRPNAPAPAPAPRHRKKLNLSWMLPVVIILLVVVAVFFMAMAMAKRTQKNIAAAPAASAPPPVETVAAPEPNPPTPAAPAAPAPPEPPPAVIGPAAIVADAPKPATVIVLQGIVNDPVHPWAIVNGKSVFLGDNVEGMRVTKISHSSITLIGNGQTNIVYVGQ